eukprot:TRINITY_DN66161_c0_g3_i5.p1 TRINITY_DN66161_c0_g3~~TRINITY_DN66161_c0_g3_i5.p1  ORF type:complete len:100 (+),score=0.77 TRINITY_DN66161_c0_g3_i5:237-536(+)
MAVINIISKPWQSANVPFWNKTKCGFCIKPKMEILSALCYQLGSVQVIIQQNKLESSHFSRPRPHYHQYHLEIKPMWILYITKNGNPLNFVISIDQCKS